MIICLDRLAFVFNACKGWSRRSVPKFTKMATAQKLHGFLVSLQGHPGLGNLPLDISVLTFVYYLDLYYFVSKIKISDIESVLSTSSPDYYRKQQYLLSIYEIKEICSKQVHYNHNINGKKIERHVGDLPA